MAISIYSKQQIVPLGISFTDKNNNYLGAICTGLVISDLNKRFSTNKFDKYIKDINITDSNIVNRSFNKIKELNNLVKFFNFPYLIFSILQNKELVVEHFMINYPYKMILKFNKQS